jgi:hypothetical protein
MFAYQSGEEIMPGDLITFHGDAGTVEFVVQGATGDLAQDWYLEEFPGGGIMVVAENWGSVFLNHPAEHEDLDFVSRKA